MTKHLNNALNGITPTHDRALDNYLSVLMTMMEELQQENPAPHVLASCREFLIAAPLPVPQLTGIPAGAQWGLA